MRYELYYWAGIQGRGEFVRLVLEEAGVDYLDVERDPAAAATASASLLGLMDGDAVTRLPFAPPFLKAGDQVLAQTANILLYLGARHGLAAADEAGRLWTHQLQLTIADWVVEIHDTHHPLGAALYYEEQKVAARQRTALFLEQRLPRFVGYFENVLSRNPDGDAYLVGAQLSYADLSLFQVIDGLRYAFPIALSRIEPQYPRVAALHRRVATRARIAAYLASDRRLPFNEDGIFRHYPELDG